MGPIKVCLVFLVRNALVIVARDVDLQPAAFQASYQGFESDVQISRARTLYRISSTGPGVGRFKNAKFEG